MQQPFFDLHHALGTRGRPFYLGGQFLGGIVEVLQIPVGDHVQGFDGLRIPLRMGVAAQLGQVRIHDLGPQLFPVQAEAAVPGQVVQAQGIQAGAFLADRLLQPRQDLL